MSVEEPQFITVGNPDEAADRRIAVRHVAGQGPGAFWLSGFKSDMRGIKAQSVADWAAKTGREVTRFDYSGHGESEGDFNVGSISAWLEEAEAVYRRQVSQPTVLVGSSMGGWLALLLARKLRARPQGVPPVAGILLIAPAVDFTEELMWKRRFNDDIRRQIMETGKYEAPSDYSDEPYVITRDLIEDGRDHLLLSEPLQFECPITILQGGQDVDVPPDHVLKVMDALVADDVIFTLVPDGDHRLSRIADIDLLLKSLDHLAKVKV